MSWELGGQLEAILPTAATLELYHNAFLIHDDIEDDSVLRRGRPTMHVDHGIPIAVNVGERHDVAVTATTARQRRTGRSRTSSAHPAGGRPDDAPDRRGPGDPSSNGSAPTPWELADADYLAMVELKTSWYSFITPLQVGAIAANARPEQLSPLESLGRSSRRRVPDHRRSAQPAGRP